MSKYQNYFVAAFVLLLVAAAVVIILRPVPRGLHSGPALPGPPGAGEMRVVLQVNPQRPGDWPKQAKERREKLEAIRRTIENRVRGLDGVTDVNVVVQDPNALLPKVLVVVRGVRDQQEALNRIRSTASLEFYYLKDVQNNNNLMGKWRMEAPMTEGKPYIFTGPRGETIDSIKQPAEVLKRVVGVPSNMPILTGRDLLPNVRANLSQNKVVVNIEFNRQGTEVFRKFTRAHVDDCLAVFFDGKLLTAPTINEPIPSGKAEISGFRSLTEARRTAEFLNSGSLPVPLKVISRQP